MSYVLDTDAEHQFFTTRSTQRIPALGQPCLNELDSNRGMILSEESIYQTLPKLVLPDCIRKNDRTILQIC